MFPVRLTSHHLLALITLAGLTLLVLGACVGRSSAEVGNSPIATAAPAPPAESADPGTDATITPFPEPPSSTMPAAPPQTQPASIQPAAVATTEQASAPIAEESTQVLLPTIINGMSSIATGWHQLGGNPQRTHYVDANLPVVSGPMNTRNQNWRVLWIWNGPTANGGPATDHLSLPDSVVPVAGDGRLYVGHSDGVVRAISMADGSQIWATAIGGSILNSGAYDQINGMVYFASTNGKLFKLSAINGELVNQFDTGAEIEQAILLVNDIIYIGTRGGHLFAVFARNMQQQWVYNAGAPITASAAYANKYDGLIIFPSEDGHVHAVRADGTQEWRVSVNAFQRPGRIDRPARYFPDVYAVVAETSDAVIIRSYYNNALQMSIPGGAPTDQDIIRQYINSNPEEESLFVLNLTDGTKRYTAPVLGGAVANQDHYYSSPPQVVVRRLINGQEVAYLLWRNRQACRIDPAVCDGREDTTLGEMDLMTGKIRFVESHKNEGTMRLPTDEQSALSMIGDVIFNSHWMSLGAIRIPDRNVGGASYSAPIPSQEYLLVSNTMAANQCTERNVAQRFCPVSHNPPGDGYQLDPGFYIYAHTANVYDQFWHPPVRSPIFDSGILYWRSSDGAIIALAPVGATPPTPEPSASAPATTETPVASATPVTSPTPASGPGSTPKRVFLPLIST